MSNLLIGKTFDYIEGADIKSPTVYFCSPRKCISLTNFSSEDHFVLSKVYGDISHLLNSPILDAHQDSQNLTNSVEIWVTIRTSKGEVTFEWEQIYMSEEYYSVVFKNDTKRYLKSDFYKKHNIKRKMNKTFSHKG